MSKKVAFLGIYTALAIILGYLENMLPVPVPVPGVKLGLSNVITLIIMYHMNYKSAFGVSVLRVLMLGFMFSGVSGILYSLSGALLSFFLMSLFKKINLFSIVGVSVIGGVFHNVGQLGMAALVIHNVKLFFYLPILLASGVITGIITGFIGGYSLGYLKKGNL